MNLPAWFARRPPKFAPVLACILLLPAAADCQGADGAAHTRAGDRMPAFSVQDTSGTTFSVAGVKGKVAVVNFWATWCGPCMVEMPLLEKDIWQKYKSSADFAMVAIAREQTQDVVADFQGKHAFTFPLAYDPHRETYALFADSGIPRTYVIDRNGMIVYQSLGYNPRDVPDLDRAIQKALAAH